MSTDVSGLREQIIANAKYMMFSTVHQTTPPAAPIDDATDNANNVDTGDTGNTGDNGDNVSKLPTLASIVTLVTPGSPVVTPSSPVATPDAPIVTPGNPAATGPSTTRPENIDIVVFGGEKEFTAAVMCGIYPVIEGATGSSPEGAMRKLLMATSELLNTIMPKLGRHQRNIHGGGVVDEDFLSRDLLDKRV